MEYRLLEKTEIWVRPVVLQAADLGACARAAAQALGLDPTDVTVTDAGEAHITFDVLAPAVSAERVVAKSEALLEALAAVPGVGILKETGIHSEGILGLINLPETAAADLLEKSTVLEERLCRQVAARAALFPTGRELEQGLIQDANTPFLQRKLEQAGFRVMVGPVLPDRAQVIARALRRAVEAGVGLVITTGGIGAEKKDQTLEALLRVDPQACLQIILKFRPGQGRHARDGVRIGVATPAGSRIVCLPGPHDEVRLSWPVLEEGLAQNWPRNVLAHRIADVLRAKFKSRGVQHAESRFPEESEVQHGSE